MINESPEKEFTRYSLKSQKDEIHDPKDTQLLGGKNFMWITAIILFLCTLSLGVVVGISITPKSAVYSQNNSVLSKYCQIVRW